FLLSLTWSIIYMLSVPSLNTGSCNETGSWIALRLNDISSGSTSNSFEISSIFGSLLFSFRNLFLIFILLYLISFTYLLTLIELLSLKYLLISPIIIGTAYVLNCTFKFMSKLSIAFIRPIQPI